MSWLPEGSDDAALEWLQEVGYPALRIEPLAGDVSSRHYSRVLLGTGGQAVLVRYPEDLLETCARFAATTEILLGVDVPVPRILATDCAAGHMLQEDAGERTLYAANRDGNWLVLEPYFRRALELSGRIAAIEPEPVVGLSPPLDAALLRRELGQTCRLLLHPRGLAGDAGGRKLLDRALDELCERLAEPPAVVCHRDFMARNLIPFGPSPGLLVIDHQDLRLGPRFYDAASLLNDSLFAPREVENRLMAGRIETDEDRLDYSRAVVQRALKAAGTFEAFAQRGNPRYRRLIPPTLERAARLLSSIPETASLAPVLVRLWRQIDLLD